MKFVSSAFNFKVNLTTVISALLFFIFSMVSGTASSQISNVDGITPLEGVVIPKLTQQQTVKPGAVFKDCDECPEMVVIPAGSFMMGSPPDPEQDPFSNAKPVKIGEDNEKPQHRVDIQSFAIGKYEVTQEQWFAVMGNNPSSKKGRTLPVENVSWDDAQLFVQKLSQKTGKKYRLPSEAEWEYAARGGSTTTYPWGNSYAESHVYAWFNAIANATNPVGLKKPNQFGLYDMLGNVWEWTQDCWIGNYKGAPTDGSAWTGDFEIGNCAQRVLRGGSWVNDPDHLRSAIRGWITTANVYSGFRVAMSIETPVDRAMRLEEEAKRKEEDTKRLVEEKKETEQRRQEQVKRLRGLGEASTGPNPNNNTNVDKPFSLSSTYLGRVRARVRPNITFLDSQLANVKGNPEAEVEVTCSHAGLPFTSAG